MEVFRSSSAPFFLLPELNAQDRQHSLLYCIVVAYSMVGRGPPASNVRCLSTLVSRQPRYIEAQRVAYSTAHRGPPTFAACTNWNAWLMLACFRRQVRRWRLCDADACLDGVWHDGVSRRPTGASEGGQGTHQCGLQAGRRGYREGQRGGHQKTEGRIYQKRHVSQKHSRDIALCRYFS